MPQTGLLITGAGFHINWDNLQQQVALPCGFYLQLNGGSASINGGELELDGHLTPELQVRLGVGYEKTEIVNPGALANAGLHAGSRLLGRAGLDRHDRRRVHAAAHRRRRRLRVRRLQLTGNSSRW